MSKRFKNNPKSRTHQMTKLTQALENRHQQRNLSYHNARDKSAESETDEQEK